tara:strand:+ start:134 stop:562 length:429 start_codon:yes stop_codon:yes gene_type:complete
MYKVPKSVITSMVAASSLIACGERNDDSQVKASATFSPERLELSTLSEINLKNGETLNLSEIRSVHVADRNSITLGNLSSIETNDGKKISKDDIASVRSTVKESELIDLIGATVKLPKDIFVALPENHNPFGSVMKQGCVNN